MLNIQQRLAAGIKHSQALKGSIPSRVEEAVLAECVPTPPSSNKETPRRIKKYESMASDDENLELIEEAPL